MPSGQRRLVPHGRGMPSFETCPKVPETTGTVQPATQAYATIEATQDVDEEFTKEKREAIAVSVFPVALGD